MKYNKKNDFKRVNINVPVELYDRVRNYAEDIGINITSAYIILLNQALDNKDMLNQMPLITATLTKAIELQENANIK